MESPSILIARYEVGRAMVGSFPLTCPSASNSNDHATIKIRAAVVRCMTEPFLIRHLKNHFQFNRRSEWKAGNAINQAARVLVFSEDALQQLGSGISNLRLIAHISRSSHRHAEPDNSRHFVERSQMFPCDRERIQRRE